MTLVLDNPPHHLKTGVYAIESLLGQDGFFGNVCLTEIRAVLDGVRFQLLGARLEDNGFYFLMVFQEVLSDGCSRLELDDRSRCRYVVRHRIPIDHLTIAVHLVIARVYIGMFDGRCMNGQAYQVFTQAFDVLSDVYFFYFRR